MRRRLIWLAVPLLLLSGCGGTGLPYAREMERMALMRVMGVDGVEGGLEVTAATGARPSGFQGQESAPLILAARGRSLSGACLEMQGQGESFVFYGYVDQVVLGEGLAHRGVEEVLDYFARDIELGLGAQVWLVKGDTARAALSGGGEGGAAERLSALSGRGAVGALPVGRTAGEVFSDLLEDGSTYIPALALSEEGALEPVGYGIFKEDALRLWVEGDAARGLELLAGRVTADVVELELSGGTAAAVIGGVDTAITPRFEEDELVGLDIVCRLNAQLTEFPWPLGEGELSTAARRLEETLEARVRAALRLLQGAGLDPLGLGRRAGMAAPGQWRALEAVWDSRYPTLEIGVEIQASISSARGGAD